MRRFVSTTFATVLGIATIGGAAYGQDRPVTQPEEHKKELDPSQTPNQQQQQKLQQGMDTQRAHDEASPARVPTPAASDEARREQIGNEKMQQNGKDYDAAQHIADKQTAPPPAPTGADEPLKRELKHDEDVKQGRDRSQWDPTPVQGNLDPNAKPVRPGS